jgi:lysyl-tRNA synthetase class 2
VSDWRPGADQAALVERAALYAGIRAFFAARDVLEVDTPLLASYGVTDPAIEPLTVAARAPAPAGAFCRARRSLP